MLLSVKDAQKFGDYTLIPYFEPETGALRCAIKKEKDFDVDNKGVYIPLHRLTDAFGCDWMLQNYPLTMIMGV